MKVALVNPPGRHRYLRDYYCAGIAKSNYYYPPIDFVWLSALLNSPIKVYDAIAQHMSLDELIKKLESFSPSHIICLVSGISFEDDLQFIIKVKKFLNAKLIILGDICRDSPEELLLNCPEVDVVLKSFVCKNINDVLSSNFPPENPFPGWTFRDKENLINQEEQTESIELEIGIPKWDIFPLKNYCFPFALVQPAATILTDYGCPFSCSFCPAGTIRWQVRKLNEVFEEINLISRLGIKEIHFRDQTFGVDKRRTLCLLEYIETKQINWSCFSRFDIVNEKLLKKMKQAGCHTIIFGIESGDYYFRKKYGKDIESDFIAHTLDLCSKLGINTVGTFIVGLPEETYENVLSTIKLAKELKLDYASFNPAIPRFGSNLRLLQKKILYAEENKNNSINDLNNELGFMPYRQSMRLASLANRKFYLRAPYIFNRFLKIKSFDSMLNEIKLGYNLFLK